MTKLISLLLVALLTACTAGENATTLREGMTPAKVEAIMGRPDGFQRSGSLVGYQYTNRLISGWSWDRADYYAVFDNDRLTQWGPGEVRPGEGANVGTLLVISMR